MQEKPSFFKEKSEASLERPEILDFFELAQKEKDNLKQEISNSEGLIRVFVHPVYTKYAPPQNKRDQQNVGRIETGLKRLLSLKDSSKVPPLFIMEEMKNIENTNNFLKREVPLLPKIYYLPTEIAVSTPTIPLKHRKILEPYRKQIQYAWSFLTKELQQLGVKKILIGGMYLWVDDKGDGNGGVGSGCLGNAIKNFSDDFEVELSNFTNPDSRREWQQLRKK